MLSETRVLPPLKTALAGPALLLVWGMAIAVLMWGSGIDVAVQRWLFANYEQNFNTVMRMMGEIGKGTALVTFCLILAGGWAVYSRWKGRKVPKEVTLIMWALPVTALASALNWVMKWSIGRGRPKEFLWNGEPPYAMQPFGHSAQWWSFPSGHSCSTFAIAVWLGLAFPRWRFFFIGMATAMSFSRFLSVTPHFAGDVVAGAALGTVVAWTVWIVRDRRLQRRMGWVSYGVEHG